MPCGFGAPADGISGVGERVSLLVGGSVALPITPPRPTPTLSPRCGGQATASPRAASVVAYCGSSVASDGDDASEAAKASYDGTVPVTMPRFGVPEAASSRRDASMVERCSSRDGYSAVREGYAAMSSASSVVGQWRIATGNGRDSASLYVPSSARRREISAWSSAGLSEPRDQTRFGSWSSSRDTGDEWRVSARVSQLSWASPSMRRTRWRPKRRG